MNEQLELTLLEALDLQEQGLSLDEILARYPAEAAQLRPYLTTAFQLGRLATQPDLAAAQQAKRDFLASAGQQGRTAQPARRRAWLGPARALAALAFLFLVAAGLLATASTAALPGDALYTTKQIVEGARLAITTDPQANAALRERFRRERLDEVRAMLLAGREGRVSVEGRIDAIDGTLWIVDGLVVTVAPGTPVDGSKDGSADIGALVQVDGRVEAGAFLAERIVVLESGPVLPTPTPRPPAAETATPRPPATPSESAPATPRPTTGPASTLPATLPPASPSPTLAAPAPTMAPVSPTAPAPQPTPTAVVDDDNNDNDDGNPNDNDNDNDDNDNDDDPNGNGNANANDNDDPNDPNGNGNANANENDDNNDNDNDPNGNDDDEGNGNDDNDNNNDNDDGDNDNEDDSDPDGD